MIMSSSTPKEWSKSSTVFDIEYYLCGPPMMSKTVLDLLHTLGVEDDMIMF